MFWLATKKRVKESLNKIKENLASLTSQNLNNRILIESNKEKIARLEGALSVLLNKSVSQSQRIPTSINKSNETFETKIMNKVRRSKKALVMAEINKLASSHEVIEMYEIVVKEKGLCSKASFYRYVAGLRSQQSQEITESKTN